ncbi:MAG TPA: AraC family transcriptional regulator [Chitinophaga sp.]|uniref:AraC family transcriptional regulator n=1 Tax=Chitinophaga sp. TaxID=1869181 RepID=UPI002DC02BD6|nr:AraC family transcriptional regulator [Chitinophaga sp.]HEU4551821.1 AraC family transcriptional regulator [Chitinophaga sp.]
MICIFTGMEIRNLYRPYELELLETSEYYAPVHKKTFFEMVFILEGRGIQHINRHQLPYISDKLFLVFPQDLHGFEVQETTRFFFIRFNNSYLKHQPAEWVKKMEFIFHNHNHLPGCIVKTMADKPLVRALVEALAQENSNAYPHREAVMAQLVNSLITVAARNISQQANGGAKAPPSDAVLPLLNYIHEHIYAPEQLKVEKIAAHFNISPNYISEYFKKITGEGLQQYIITYKMKLIETRLRFTDNRIRDIAFEFGFTDESHLNRLFKKHTGQSPTAYRKQYFATF